MSEGDPYSLPVAPTWIGLNAGEGGRFTARNRDVRESLKVPPPDRVLELACGKSPIAVVFPRGPHRLWRLQLLDEEQPLSEPGLYGPTARFLCVCARVHEVDRKRILEEAARLEPRTRGARARRIDFRRVARVVRPD